MKLLTNTQTEQLLNNGRVNAAHIGVDGKTEDFIPVVKIFCPWTGATWLLTELDPDDPDLAFGLCDLGFGCPELGNVRLSEIEGVRGPGGLTIERDIHFTATKTLTEYAEEAYRAGAIVA
ncbi:DUF2958 domain-containing protein [Rhodopseudomonas sp. NSM]|uniref:DUF2958 domain-containing protein n=1 Tax=Rhodopseudomonas sp. NSM TaxID=3457630 RepID=UPI004036A3FA